MFGRKLRNNVPQAPKKLVSSYSDAVKQHVKDTDDRVNAMQKYYADQRHVAREKSVVQSDDHVLIRDRNKEEIVVRPAENAPRSVINIPTDSNTS